LTTILLWRELVQITWHGHSCFRLRGSKGTVVTDPYGKGIGYNLPRLRGDIVTISHDHPDHDNADLVKGNPKVINGPGEYEIKGIFVIGIPTFHDSRRGTLRGRNTVYLFDFEELTVCHLGDLGHVPTQAQVEDLGDVDVLLVPVGGVTTIGPAEASEVISLLEPKIVIPMHYKTDAAQEIKLQPVDQFLKEMGTKNTDPQDSLKVRKGGLPSDTQIMIMNYAG
jgi:L-ascorbate metabolism protein UlaG (beta-lactamase superfamily)